MAESVFVHSQDWIAMAAMLLAGALICVAVWHFTRSLRDRASRPQATAQNLREGLILIRTGTAEALNPIARKWMGGARQPMQLLGECLKLRDPAQFEKHMRQSVDPAFEQLGSKLFHTTDGRCLDIVAQADNWQVRLSLVDVTVSSVQRGHALDEASRALRGAEAMNELAERAPILQWRTHEDSTLLWSNAAMMERHKVNRDALDAVMALPIEHDGTVALPSAPKRVCVPDPTGVDGHAWFDLCRVARPGHGVMSYAVPAQRTVNAEQSLARFVETLTETFAHLPTGLAIFDKNRELGLFNPALATLLGLDPAWLAGRPNLSIVLNALREKRALPDQQDFRSWREGLLSLGQPGGAERYEEEWMQPSGRSLRVIARPHPHGALAVLVEDITTDLALERQFRARTEMRDAALEVDGMPRLLIDMDGQITYRAPEVEAFAAHLLDEEPAAHFGPFLEQLDAKLPDGPSLDIGPIRRFVARSGESGAVMVAPLRPMLALKLQKLRGGGTIATFRGSLAPSALSGGGRTPRVAALLRDSLRQNDYLLDMITVSQTELAQSIDDLPCQRVDLLRRVTFNMLLSISELGRDGCTLSIHADANDTAFRIEMQLDRASGSDSVVEPDTLLPVTLLRRYLTAEGGGLCVAGDTDLTLTATLPITALSPGDTVLHRIAPMRLV